MSLSFTLPRWYDLHAHFRQDDILPAAVADHIAMGCAGFLAMPNTKPPLTCVFQKDETPEQASIERYHTQITKAGQGKLLDIIVPLYLSRHTTPKIIEEGAKSGLLRAAKYYPPHGTTGAEFAAPLQHYIDNGVIAALEAAGVTLCLHGEEHALPAEDYFDRQRNAEIIFYTQRMPELVEKFPTLNIVGEHLTTAKGVEFITQAPEHVKATITPQHLLYTVGHLLQGFKYHLYCLPLVKFEEDRAALRAAVLSPENTKFFAGTDSAPHTQKVTPCGCAAGCYTGGIAPQLYAEAFERAGADLSDETGQQAFESFLCRIGQEFYNLPTPTDQFTLTKTPQEINALNVPNGQILPLPMGIENGDGKSNAVLNWSLNL